VQCYHCRHRFEVSRQTLTTVCPKCSKSLTVEDVVIKTAHGVRKIQTCGRLVVQKKGHVIAQLIEAHDGVEVEGILEGKVISGGPVRIGPKASWKGDCSAPDAMSAGGHFNPTNMKHGAPDAEEHHQGDLGNITADKSGKGTVTITLKGATLGEGDTSIAGKGFIIHAKADDMKTQPTGNAGDRVACGTITVDDAAGAAADAK